MDTGTIWSECLTMLREEVGSRVVETWFKALHIRHWDSGTGTVYIQTPNTFVKEWVAQRYSTLLERHLSRLLREDRVAVNLVDPITVVAEQLLPSTDTALAVLPATRVGHRGRKEVQQADGSLHKTYRFDTFIVGPHNSLAYAAAYAVTEKPGVLYNPFFIYGSSGLGKTHLLHAIGNELHARQSQRRILYQNANKFVSDFITAIRFDRVYQFEARYKNVDVLLIDDVQFLSNKEQTQEAFFHIFNIMHQAHRQIICTSDSLPRDIAGLADRVRSRLESGLVTDISEPVLETKIAIVKRKAELQGEQLSDDVAEYVALAGTSNVRDLEGALIRVLAYASLTKQPLNLDIACQALERHTEKKKSEKLDLGMIAEHVARHFGYTIVELRSADRSKNVAFARHVALFFMKKLTEYSLRDIAAFLHRTDHSIVLYAITKLEALRAESKSCAQMLHLIERQLTEQ